MYMKIVYIKDKNQLNNFIGSQKMSQFLQAFEWGEFQEKVGGKVFRIGVEEDGKLVGMKLINKGVPVEVRAKVFIGADGFESQVGRWAGIDTNLKSSDIMTCVQYRLTNIECDPKYTEFYAGSAAPGGYIWIFPKSATTANVGIGMGGAGVKKGGDPKKYLDAWIAKNPKMQNAKQLDMIAGGCSVCAPLDSVVTDNVMLVGDAARMIDPMTGGGIAHACLAGRFAGMVAADAIKAGDYSKEFFQKYEKLWRAEIEEKLFLNWMAKEKLVTISDEVFDKLIKLLGTVGMDNISVFNILNAIKEHHPELVEEFQDLI